MEKIKLLKNIRYSKKFEGIDILISIIGDVLVQKSKRKVNVLPISTNYNITKLRLKKENNYLFFIDKNIIQNRNIFIK